MAQILTLAFHYQEPLDKNTEPVPSGHDVIDIL